MANETWNFDPAHSEITFKVRHMMFSKVSGSFDDWEGTFQFNPDDPAAMEASADINVASIDTGNGDRDDHLRSEDFFDVENHPTMQFESGEVEEASDGQFKLHGTLTICGESNPVELDVEYHGKATDPWGNQRVGFTATTTLNRKEFGLTWNQALETGGVLVGEDVEVELNLQAVQG